MDDDEKTLQAARELIESGKFQEALVLLIWFLRETDPQSAEGWYLLGFALTEPEKNSTPSSKCSRKITGTTCASTRPIRPPGTRLPGWPGRAGRLRRRLRRPA